MNFECVLFDVDGCLVDIRKSYNAAIKKTVDFILNYVVTTGSNMVTSGSPIWYPITSF